MSTDTFEDVCEVCRKAYRADGLAGDPPVVVCEDYRDIETGEVHTLCLPHATEWRRADNAAAREELAYWGDED